ncbi:MAG: hypothetical protein H8D94_01950 [Candidatus Pelagibacter sp.]|nr:hypothetical protein [Candidatus Pelagibacter sp.]
MSNWYDFNVLKTKQLPSFDMYSQYGEEGVLEHIFNNINHTANYCVDIGAMDGVLSSTTKYMREQYNWDSLLLEGSTKHQQHNKDVKLEWVTKDNVIQLFEKYNVPKDISMVNIDIDYNDYWITEAIMSNTQYNVDLFVVEFNPGIPSSDSLTVPYNEKATKDATYYFGTSLLALEKLALEHNYKLLYSVRDNEIGLDKTYDYSVERSGRNALLIDEKHLPKSFNQTSKQLHPVTWREPWKKPDTQNREYIGV